MTSTYRKSLFLFATIMLLASSAFAATITGSVKNVTTGKPSVGDKVDLLALQQGMSVLASTKTDAQGSFSFSVDDLSSPHLVRATHDGVSYFPAGGPLQPGKTSTSIDVYDASNKVDGITTNVKVVRMQTDSGNLQVMELFAIKNASNPPRALNGEKTYQFNLPEGAQVEQVLVQGPGGMPVNTSATPEGKSGKYSFSYAIKPGDTRFEVAYHLPYSGHASFDPKMPGEVQHFLVMLPKSMTFTAKSGAKFSPMDDPTATVQVATNVNASSSLAFEVSGTGALQDDQQNANQQGSQSQTADSSQSSGMSADNRPGGGLGPPTDAPDPLSKSRALILGGLGVVLICGAAFVVSRSNQQNANSATAVPSAVVPTSTTSTPAVATQTAVAQPADKTSMLLEGLKDELFQLEIEKQQGRISEADYEAAKAALDQTLKRALARKA